MSRGGPIHIVVVEPGSAGAGAVRLAAERGDFGPCRVEAARTLEEAVERLGPEAIDMVVVDLGGRDPDPLSAVREVVVRHPGRPVVVFGGAAPAPSREAATAPTREAAPAPPAVHGVGTEGEGGPPHPPMSAGPGADPEAALRQAARRYRTLFERSSDAILVVNGEGTIRDANARVRQVFGYDPAELVGRRIECLVPEPARGSHPSLREEYLRQPVPRPMAVETELRALRKDGSQVPVEIGLSPLPWQGHTLILASVRDMTEAMAGRRLAAIVDASDDAILSIALDGTIETWNRGAAVYFEDRAETAIGRPISHYLAPEVIEQLPDLVRRVRAGEHVHSVENEHVRGDGRRFHLLFSFSPLTGREGDVTGAAVIGRDLTWLKLLEEDLKQLAFYDPLTRLANRRFFLERLDYSLALARRRGTKVGLLYLDLQGFKEINDRLGHAAGDTVLVGVGDRLRRAARESDVVARLGGDEFVVLLSEVEAEEAAREAADRFRASLARPIRAAGRSIEVNAQFGLALFPEHGADSAALLAAADRAMYLTKQSTRRGSPLQEI